MHGISDLYKKPPERFLAPSSMSPQQDGTVMNLEVSLHQTLNILDQFLPFISYLVYGIIGVLVRLRQEGSKVITIFRLHNEFMEFINP